MGGHYLKAAARAALLCLVFASPLLAQPPGGRKEPAKGKEQTEIHGSAILVTTNSEGVTEIFVGKPTMNVTDILQFIGSLNPFSRSARALWAVPLTAPRAPAVPPPFFSLDLAKDSLVLVAPIQPGLVKEDVQDYAAYILPKGLSSLPREMSSRLLVPPEGTKKVGLLMFPPDVNLMGATGRQPSSDLFPLDNIRVREVKIVDGDVGSTKLDAVLESFGFAGHSGSPWLILRDVAEDKVGNARSPEARDAEEEGAKPTAEGGAKPTAEESAKPWTEEIDGPFKEFGTLHVNKDGVVTWVFSPNAFELSRIPFVPPNVQFPPIPPPIPFPWFNNIPMPNPFFLPFSLPPIPYWGINPPNPYVLHFPKPFK